MKQFLSKSGDYRPCIRAAAFVVFLATPGSMLVLPLLAWWWARKGQLAVPAGIRN